jgi:hypothetical protein
MSKQKSKTRDDSQQDKEQRQVRQRRFKREIVGMFLGISVALILGALLPEINENYSLGIVVLWGGALGGFVASYERFEQAGAILTRGENRGLNLLIGAGLPVGLLVLIFLWSRG